MRIYPLIQMTFSPENAILFIEDFSQNQQFEVKNYLLMKLSLHKTSIDGLESCGSLVDYCVVFFSCLDSHSDGTHSLQRIHWWASDSRIQSIYWHVHSEENKFPFTMKFFICGSQWMPRQVLKLCKNKDTHTHARTNTHTHTHTQLKIKLCCRTRNIDL